MRHVGALSLLIACALVGAARTASGAGPAVGEVVYVDGAAFIRGGQGGEQSGTFRAAKVGDPLRAGDVVNTSDGAKMKILLKDKTIVDVGPLALFKVNGFESKTADDRQVEMTMAYGSIRTAVTEKLKGGSHFRVKTAQATMGVRGTEFVISAPPADLSQAQAGMASAGLESTGSRSPASVPEMSVTVLQGRVDVSSAQGKVASLTEGMQVSASGASAGAQFTQPTTLNASQLSAIASSARIEDAIFQKETTTNATSLDSAARLASSIGPTGLANSGLGGVYGAASALSAPPPNVQAASRRTVQVEITR